MALFGRKPRRRGGAEPSPASTSPPDTRRKPRLKKLRFLFVLLGLSFLGPGLDRLRDDGRGLPGPAGDLQLRPVQGVEKQRGLRRLGRTDRNADQQPEQNPAQLGPDLPQHQERGGLDRGRALLRAQRRRLRRHRPRPGQGRPQPERRRRAARRSPSSSSRTRSPRRAAGRSSRSSGRRRSPTGSSATGARTKSSPSTSTRSTSARAPTASRRRRGPTSAPPTPAAGRRPSPAPRCSSPGRRRRWRRSSPRPRPTTPSTTRKTRSGGATSCSKRCTNRATSRRPSTAKGSSRRCRRRRTSNRRPWTPRPRTSPPGCASSWSIATEPRKPSSAGSRSRPRST